MTYFLRILEDEDKSRGLSEAVRCLREDRLDRRLFSIDPNQFSAIPTSPFAYWISEAVRDSFRRFPAFEDDSRTARQGLATAEDFRFVRAWWEEPGDGWYGFAKGGIFSPFYADVYLLVNWRLDGSEIKAGICRRYPYLNGNAEFVAKNPQFYFRPGVTWPRRTKSRLSMRALPQGCVFADKSPAAFVEDDDPMTLLYIAAIGSSKAFQALVATQLAAADAKAGGAAHSFETGVIQRTPMPCASTEELKLLASLSLEAWSLSRELDTTNEVSHAFLLPSELRYRCGGFDSQAVKADLARVQSSIDSIAFDAFGFGEADTALQDGQDSQISLDDELGSDEDVDEGDELAPVDNATGLFSWAVGVAFGRFDWRLATAERAEPHKPGPFDPLPAKSPGMLPDGAPSFHVHSGILVDDPGHPHDLVRVAEEVLARVGVAAPEDLRRWLQRDFFPFHLQRYSKSRRKAPVYWPLSTVSGSYTLWLYYPSIGSQTLYTSVNDFVEPKLKQVSVDVAILRNKGTARARDDERRFEALRALEVELIELRDSLLRLAPTYNPKSDDGVQISAAPLWLLFRHKPWQKLLKDTWAKLEKGEYDWAHLAMNYWPDRVREKCKTDQSLAIAHGLERLYVEPEVTPKKSRGKKKGAEA